jgi:hypothetical protein
VEEQRLNELVLEHVFGWKRTGDEDWVRPRHRILRDKDVALAHDDWESKGPHPRLESPDGESYYFCSCQLERGYTLPEFAGDITDAWRVVEKMRHSEDEGEFADQLRYDACPLGDEKGSEIIIYLMRHLSPKNICVAALLAKGIDVEE